jgi:hypothetical protein
MEELAMSAGTFSESNQFPTNPNLFWYDHILMTESLAVRVFHFTCTKGAFAYGVVEVRFAEEVSVDP